MKALTIGKLAKLADVSIDTIRYYEKSGLLPEPHRLDSGYRVYASDAPQRLHFIRSSKNLGFTLHEIGELLALSGQSQSEMKAMQMLAQSKLKLVQDKIQELKRMETGLEKLIALCPGCGPIKDCPIVSALTQPSASLLGER